MFLCRPAAIVGRRLAEIGDDINARYTPVFNSMIRSLNLAPDASDSVAYDAFSQVAMRSVWHFKSLEVPGPYILCMVYNNISVFPLKEFATCIAAQNL